MNPPSATNVIRVAFGAGRRVIRTELQARAAADALYREAGTCDEDPETFVRAEHLYRQAIALDPDHALAQVNLGNVLFRTNRDAEARAQYERALAIDPTVQEAHYNLGYLLMEEGDNAGSIPFFRRAIEIDPNFGDAWFNLAMALQLSFAPPAEERAVLAHYLTVESIGEWADIARERLAVLSPRPAKAVTPSKRTLTRKISPRTSK